MPEFSEYAPGTPCWVDVTTPDLDRTVAFYSALFGWHAERDPRPEAGGYTMFFLHRRLVAAASPPPPGSSPPHWTTYLATDDADAAAARVRSAGGTVIAEPFDVLEAGRMALAQDPTGAAFALWQAGTHHGAQLANDPGTLTWNECRTHDPAAAETFYRAVFDYGIQTVPMGPGEPYRVLEVEGRGVGGLSHLGPGRDDVPSHWAVTFAVADTDETCARAGELGAETVMPPADLPGIGRYALLVDPVGAAFGMIANLPG